LDPLFIDRKGQENNRGRISTYLKIMRNLLIRWVHLSVKGETCERCSDTGKNIVQIIGDLKNDLRFKEVDLEFDEIKLPPEKIGSSNEIF